MKYFSMFSGIGGFELGIQTAIDVKSESDFKNGRIWRWDTGENKFHFNADLWEELSNKPECVGFSEVDKYAIQIYQKHFKGHKPYGNARRIVPEEIQDFDLLCGGFPCQAFSIAGKRGGFKDTRGTLFYEIARIVSIKRPKLLFLENVKGLLSHDNGRTFGTILATFSELGYICEWQVLNSKDFGVPQSRERVFIIGHLGGGSRPKVFPVARSSFNNNKCNITHHHKSFRECKTVYDKNGIVNTLKTMQGGNVHPMVMEVGKVRRLTPTECERLQGFPDGWTEGVSNTQRYKCLGNAVTVNVIEAIARRLFEKTN